jgi:propionyl-CoA synthetase
VLASHPDVAECAVIGIKDEIKGKAPRGFIVLKAGVNRLPIEIEKEIVALVREKIGPVGSPSRSPSRWRGCRRRDPARYCAAP